MHHLQVLFWCFLEEVVPVVSCFLDYSSMMMIDTDESKVEPTTCEELRDVTRTLQLLLRYSYGVMTLYDVEGLHHVDMLS